VNRYRAKLVSINLLSGQLEAVMAQIHDILGFHVSTMTAHETPKQRMTTLAVDAYIQGLIDGAQVEAAKQSKGA
jgi:hypothetical protein